MLIGLEPEWEQMIIDVSRQSAWASMEAIRREEMQGDIYTVTILILCEDEPLHTDEKPFCGQESCPCHSIDNFEAVWRLKTQLAQGLITYDEHVRIWHGQNI